MAGYSGTPLPKKLGVKTGQTLAVLNAPSELGKLMSEFPETAKADGKAAVDIFISFHKNRASLQHQLPRLKSKMANDGMLWVAWPKRASGVPTDLNENVIREAALKLGLVDVKVCAIDETWSGLKLVIPVKARAKAGSRIKES